MKNPIIAELRRIRDARAKRHNFDIEAMARDLTKLEPWMERKTYALRRGRMISPRHFAKESSAGPPLGRRD